jgi:choline dehydrogenase-like flavoprotein
MDFDDIIVGGGSAGAVLAARLSQDPARRVLLLEAGPDYPTLESIPAHLRDGWRMSLRDHDWALTAQAVPGRAIPYPRGRVIGGSSAVNATIALRGVPADYDQWAALGNDQWSWAKVLPHFRRLEDDPEGDQTLHGRGGPIAICCWRPDEPIPVQRAFLQVCRRLSFAEVTDHNHSQAAGVGPFPQSRRGRLRLSTAIGYLLPARHRPNLTIRPHCLVNRVLVAGDRAVGVDIASDGGPAQVRGRRITPAAGAIGSPAILLRSGIGPRPRWPAWASSRWPTFPASARAWPITRSPGCCSSPSRAAATRRPRSRRWSCATPPPARVSSTTCSRSCSATSTWRASAARRRWRRRAHRSRSGCPSRSNARTRAAAWSWPAPTRGSRR